MTDKDLRDKLASEACSSTDELGYKYLFKAGWDAARANDAMLRNTAGYELGRRAVEVTENALHDCQRERDQLKAEVERLRGNSKTLRKEGSDAKRENADAKEDLVQLQASAEKLAKALERCKEWIETNHDMPSYSELLLDAAQALAEYREKFSKKEQT